MVRKSDRAANIFVLMLKLTPVTGMQKRIIFSRGKFIMECNGVKRAHSDLAQLLMLEVCRSPARPRASNLDTHFPDAEARASVVRTANCQMRRASKCRDARTHAPTRCRRHIPGRPGPVLGGGKRRWSTGDLLDLAPAFLC